MFKSRKNHKILLVPGFSDFTLPPDPPDLAHVSSKAFKCFNKSSFFCFQPSNILKINCSTSDNDVPILIRLLILNFRVANGHFVQRIFLAKFSARPGSPAEP